MSDNNSARPTDNSVVRDNIYLTTLASSLTPNMHEILYAVVSNHHITTISSTVDKNKGNVHRTLKRLIQRDLVSYNESTSVYTTTDLGNKILLLSPMDNSVVMDNQRTTKTSKGASMDNRECIPSSYLTLGRGHNIRVLFKIKNAPPGWKESRTMFFKMHSVKFTDLNLKNVDGVQFSHENNHVKAMEDHVSVILQEFKIEHAIELMPEIMDRGFRIRKELEKKFKGLVFEEEISITVGELAIEKDFVGQLCDRYGYMVIRHTDNVPRIIIDHSKGPVELEFVHPKYFDIDQEKWERNLYQIVTCKKDYLQVVLEAEQAKEENKIQNDRLDSQDSRIEGLISVASTIVKNQEYYGEHIVSHVGAIKTLGTNVEHQTELLLEFATIMKELRDAIGGMAR